MLAVAYESSGQPCHRFLRNVIPDHLQSCATLLDCWWLTVVFILSTRAENCNAYYYVTNVIPKLVRDTTSLVHDGFIFQQDGAPAHRACNLWLVTCLMQWLYIMCGVPCWRPITSWTSKPSTTEDLQTILEKIWNDFPQKPVARAVCGSLFMRHRVQLLHYCAPVYVSVTAVKHLQKSTFLCQCVTHLTLPRGHNLHSTTAPAVHFHVHCFSFCYWLHLVSATSCALCGYIFTVWYFPLHCLKVIACSRRSVTWHL